MGKNIRGVHSALMAHDPELVLNVATGGVVIRKGITPPSVLALVAGSLFIVRPKLPGEALSRQQTPAAAINAPVKSPLQAGVGCTGRAPARVRGASLVAVRHHHFALIAATGVGANGEQITSLIMSL